MIAFFVQGKPATAGSKKAFVVTPKGGGKPRAVVTDSCKGGRAWRSDVQAAALAAMRGRPLLDGALEVELLFLLPKPASCRRHYPTVRPDVDKLSRALLDALKLVVWHDDAQVVRKLAVKAYCEPGVTPGVIVSIARLVDRASVDAKLVHAPREPVPTVPSGMLPGPELALHPAR